MNKINLDNIQQSSVEQLILLSIERLIELKEEASSAYKEAQEKKEWISGIIAIRNNTNHTNNNPQINYGGENEQATDYI